MRAAWYDRQGSASEVLEVGELQTPGPSGGEVRVALTLSGVNPGDVKKRQGWLGSGMPYARVIPHSDGAGVIDAVGPGVDPGRVGRRVLVYGAQSYRPFGTAAQAVVVPGELAVALPDSVADELAASLGIPGITAHRAVFVDGPVTDQVVVVHGVLGAVGSLAAQLARWGGATVIGTVRHADQLGRVDARSVRHAISLDGDDPVEAIRAVAPDGVQRIVEVALGPNVELDAAIVANGAVIAAYASPDERPALPFWPLLFANVTLRLLGSDDFPARAKQRAIADLLAAADAGALDVRTAPAFTLEEIVQAHEAVERNAPDGRVLVAPSR